MHVRTCSLYFAGPCQKFIINNYLVSMRAKQERVRQLLTEAVGLLCRNTLQFDEQVQVD